jgi:hypothetical protein
MSTWTNETRNSATWTNEARNSVSWTNETPGATTTGQGIPIGLLLALTYSGASTFPAWTNEQREVTS